MLLRSWFGQSKVRFFGLYLQNLVGETTNLTFNLLLTWGASRTIDPSVILLKFTSSALNTCDNFSSVAETYFEVIKNVLLSICLFLPTRPKLRPHDPAYWYLEQRTQINGWSAGLTGFIMPKTPHQLFFPVSSKAKETEKRREYNTHATENPTEDRLFKRANRGSGWVP